jgi:hypothetical protein
MVLPDVSRYPRQGDRLGKRVEVCFGLNEKKFVTGTCVRDDIESPYRMLFVLDDARVIDATECRYRLDKNHPWQQGGRLEFAP